MATVENIHPRKIGRPGAAADPRLGAGIDRSRLPLAEAWHLPGYIYESPELFALEKDKIYMKDWLAVARVEEIAKPGDFMTFEIVGEPIVVSRHQDGKLYAYYNSCAHRGVAVTTGKGNAAKFTCPYHAWTYDLSGKLVGAGFMDDVDGFDPETCRLRPVKLDVWEGWVFVNFDERAAPLSSFVAEFASAFGKFGQGRFKLTGKMESTFDCNWKLINENFVDLYHFQTLHPTTLVNWPKPGSYPWTKMRHGGYATFYENNMPVLDSLRPLGPAPWLPDDIKTKPLFGGAGFLTPNFTTFVRPYSIAQIIVWPLSPSRTYVCQYITVPETYFDLAPDLMDRVKNLHELMTIITEEDRPMIESLQKRVGTRGFKPGRLSTGEFLVHHYINDYLERMFGAAA